MKWEYERCHAPRCRGRRNIFGYHVPDEIWKRVVPKKLRGRSVCLTCFDEMAQRKGVKYLRWMRMILLVGHGNQAAIFSRRKSEKGK